MRIIGKRLLLFPIVCGYYAPVVNAEPKSKPSKEPQPTDNELMERLKDGDMSALEVIYMRYSSMVKAAINREGSNIIPADQEELSQDIFMALVQSAPNFDSSKKLKPWLYGISVNKALGFKRTGWLHRNLLTRHRKETETLQPRKVKSPSSRLENRQELEKAFQGLPKDQHEVMILHAVEGFKGEEIAKILNIEVNTVWTRLHRARKNMMANLT